MRRLPLFLVSLLALALVLAWWVPDLRWTPPPPVPPGIEQIHLSSLQGSPGLETMHLLTRPPFWASRRPLEGNIASVTATTLDGVQVVGVVRVEGGAVVLVRHPEGVARVMSGTRYGDWLFEGVRGDQAIFSRGSDQYALPVPRSRVDGLPRREAN